MSFINGRWIVSDIGVEMAQKLEALIIKRSFKLSLLKGSLLWRSARLEVVPWLVLWFGGSEVIFKESLQVLEGGPLLGVSLPALKHELMQGAGAVLRAGHPVTTLHLLKHFPVVHA